MLVRATNIAQRSAVSSSRNVSPILAGIAKSVYVFARIRGFVCLSNKITMAVPSLACHAIP